MKRIEQMTFWIFGETAFTGFCKICVLTYY